MDMTEPIHQRLSEKHLLPAEHAMDAGYVDGDHLVNCQNTHAVELIGPVANNPSWQARAGQGFDVAHFSIDWQAHKAT